MIKKLAERKRDGCEEIGEEIRDVGLVSESQPIRGALIGADVGGAARQQAKRLSTVCNGQLHTHRAGTVCRCRFRSWPDISSVLALARLLLLRPQGSAIFSRGSPPPAALLMTAETASKISRACASVIRPRVRYAFFNRRRRRRRGRHRRRAA